MWNWSRNGIWWNDVEAFSRRSFSKTERNGTGHGSSGWVEKRGRLVSSRVGSGERRSLPDSTQASLFFRFASNRLDKLSTKAVMQTMSDYYRYFLRVSSGTTFYKRGIDTKDKIKASPVVYRTTLIIATVIFCNQIMTQKRI